MNVKEGPIFLIQNRLTGEPDIALCPILSGKKMLFPLQAANLLSQVHS